MPAEVSVSLEFIKRLELYEREKPYWLFVGKPDHLDDSKLTNVELEVVPGIPAHDVRNDGHSYTLDEHGFQFVTHQQSFSDFDDEEAIRTHYLPQVEEVIRQNVPYAKRVLLFDWRLRRQMSEEEGNALLSANQIQQRSQILAPSQTVHTDVTEFSLLKRVKVELPEEADELVKGRVQMVKLPINSFWRPIRHPAHNWPLFVCDGRSVGTGSLVAVDQITRSFVGDIYYAHHDPAFQWYYMSSMGLDEGVLFKSWDTGTTAPSKVCLHSSSALPEHAIPDSQHPRFSIEARAVVFSDL
ncbi:hypothetical protein RB601_009626 [Gaeumannomyces tritici]